MIVEALLLVTSPAETPIQPPEPPAIVEQIELTVEEKIEQNFYKCNTDTEWIWAQDATCHPKQSNTQPEPQKASVGSQNSSQTPPKGWYPYGQCTYWVWKNRPVGKWNNASQWRSQAQRDGWTVSKTPIVGAIAWESNHVALVESIDGDKVTVSEMNFKGLGVVSKRTVAATRFSYIY